MIKVLIIGESSKLAKDIINKLELQKLKVKSISSKNLDITKYESVNLFFSENNNFDFIINCAAYTNVKESECNYSDAEKLNVQSVSYLAENAKKYDIPIVHISTDYVFDGNKNDSYIESDKPKPINNYGKTKYKGELVLSGICDKYIILRVSWLFCDHGNNFLTSMIDKISTERKVCVVNNQIGTPTSTKYLANNIYKMCVFIKNNAHFNSWGLYHLANSHKTTWFVLSCKIKEFMQLHGYDCKADILDIYNCDNIRPKNSALCCNKFFDVFRTTSENWAKYLDDDVKSLKIKSKVVTYVN